ncbi:C-type lectin domain family 6 member A-like isoform 4-T4 [Clarias gariepinus]
MENTYKNFELSKMDSTENCQLTKVAETEDDVYVNTLQLFPVPKTRPETAQLYDMLKVKHQQVHDRLSACSANQKCTLCEKPLGLKCYYVSTEKLSWTQSRDYCVEKGGHLVIITSQAEQDFVSSQIKETHWIGLNDLETEGEWMWVNNQPLNETSVTFWYDEGPHEPDNWKVQDPSGENCAALGDENGNTHKWFDASCHKLKKCICEK